MTSPPPQRSPSTWLLLDDRPGHRTQVIGLARDLGWPWEEKQLRFNRLQTLPRAALGATLANLEGESQAQLRPPFPDLVIGMGRRIVPAARWIRRQSGGRTRIVLIGRKIPNDPAIVDLAVVCAHFNQITHPGLFELVVPPTQVSAETLRQAREGRADPMAGLARPHVLFLVGGPTSQHFFDAGIAGKMASEVATASARLGGGLAIVTSRRTPPEALAAMRHAAPAAHFHEWRADRADNPYLSYLAHADLIVATGESESMLAEAVATGRPLTVYPLPPRPARRKDRRVARLAAIARGSGMFAALGRALFARGWITPPRDLGILHRLLEQHGLARSFAGEINQQRPRPHDESATLASRIRAMFRSPADPD